jgi:hypothetical protein
LSDQIHYPVGRPHAVHSAHGGGSAVLVLEFQRGGADLGPGEVEAKVVEDDQIGRVRIVKQLHMEISSVVAEAATEARHAERQVRRWRAVDLGLGLPTAILAAVAGATALTSAAGRIPAAVLAIAAAVLSASSTFLKSEARAADAERRSSAWSLPCADARLVHIFDVTRPDQLRQHLRILLARTSAIRNGDFETARRLRDDPVTIDQV